MATLQKIRSKGALLVIVIGVALLAFIAGDAWQVLQPHQAYNVGEVNGEELSGQDYQSMVEEYAEVIKMSQNLNALSDEQMNRVYDDVWNSYVNNKLIEKEAEALGLTVSTAEIQDILKTGTDPLLRQSPFQNPQTGRFDRDMLNKFLVEYAQMSETQLPAQYVEQYQKIYKYWSFIERMLVQTRLAQKYQMLVAKSLFSNPVEAQAAFDADVNQYNLLMAAVPYSSIADSTLAVSEAELTALYNKKKEEFKQYAETRDIKYIDVQVKASDEDKAAIQKEVEEATSQLASAEGDYASLVRSAGSDVPYVDLFCNRTAYPPDVVARLDSSSVGAIYGPYYNSADNTVNSFKIIAKATAPDSIEFRQIQVYAENVDKTKTLADSIYNALKGGADFTALAEKYGQPGDSLWLVAAQYEGAQVEGDNLKFISALNNAKVNEILNLPLGQANLILQVINKKAMKEKFKVAVIKREFEFSKETYSRAYNDFSQFIAANPTLEQMEANAEEAGYQLQEINDLSSANHTVAGVRGTKEALRWIFDVAEPGDVSGLYECGDNDHMMVVGLAGVSPEGYRSLEKVQAQLRYEILRDKKAEKIMADMKAANATTIEQYKSMPNVVTDSLKMVTFAAPAYIPSMRSSEPLVGAYASVAEEGKLSEPIKGMAGVYVLQLYGKDKLNEEFDKEQQESSLMNLHMRMAGRLMNDLYLKANVKDTRYMFF